MMRRLIATGIMLAAMLTSAQAMTVADFLAKADGLKAKGMMAMMSPDVGVLRTEMKAVSTAYRADIDDARKAKMPSHSCPPPKGKSAISSDEVIAAFQAIPVGQRAQMSVKDRSTPSCKSAIRADKGDFLPLNRGARLYPAAVVLSPSSGTPIDRRPPKSVRATMTPCFSI